MFVPAFDPASVSLVARNFQRLPTPSVSLAHSIGFSNPAEADRRRACWMSPPEVSVPWQRTVRSARLVMMLVLSRPIVSVGRVPVDRVIPGEHLLGVLAHREGAQNLAERVRVRSLVGVQVQAPRTVRTARHVIARVGAAKGQAGGFG